MGFCAVALVAGLLAAAEQPPAPPPPDTCCLTYGQTQGWIEIYYTYIPLSAVSQCLIDSAKEPTQYPAKNGSNKEFKFIPDQTVGLKQNKDETWEVCIQWKAVEEKVLKKEKKVLLMYDGKPPQGK